MYRKSLLSLLIAPTVAIPAPGIAQPSSAEIEEQVVTGVRARMEQAGVLKDVIEQTELIGNATLESTQSVSLSDALGNSPGADVAIDCAMCGFKRLRLNGPVSYTHLTLPTTSRV